MPWNVAYSPTLHGNILLRTLLTKANLDKVHLLSLLRDASNASESGHSRPALFQKVACDWVRRSQHIWSRWLPDPSTCAPGQYYERSSLECEDCGNGTYSFRNSTSGERDCVPCRAGHFAGTGWTVCDPCPAGFFTATSGSSACTPCHAGSHQERAGQMSCAPCLVGSWSAGSVDGSIRCLLC